MLVAVYGSLRQGFGNHRIISKEPLSTETLKLPFYMISLSAFPALVTLAPSELRPITVEVYDVDASTFSRLDMLEGYPDFYTRSQVSTSQGETWIYHFATGTQGYSHSPVESGDWREYCDELMGV